MTAPRDVEDELRIERRARRLLQALAVAAASSTGRDETLGKLLREVCAATGWPVGHVLRRAGDAMESARIWHLDDGPRFEAFRIASESARFERGEGLPGRVLASGDVHWIADVLTVESFPRREQAAGAGLRSACAFPVCAAGQVALVLEFASLEPLPPDAPLLEVMEVIGAQVGWIIERSRAQRAQADSEQRLRNVTETANDAIITVDAEGKILSWNDRAEQMFGWAREEVEGDGLHRIIPERFRAAHEAGLARVRSGGERRVIGKTVELAGLRKDGSELPIELSLSAWSMGGVAHYTGIVRDITERRRVEEQLRATTERLAGSERDAVAASKAKSLFLANMSHELRTPLNAILGFVRILERDRRLVPEQLEHLAIISRSGHHLLGLIDDVLSIAKIEAGERELRAAPFDLPRLLASLRDMFHLRAQSRGLGLLFDLDGALPVHVEGDEGKLRQVLINLLGNALKFTDRGGIAVRVRATGERIAFEVEDTGIGIAADDLPRLFQPFLQAGEAHRAAEGTGLGLSICRDFVRLMGGDLQVKSTVGAGTLFAFDVALPRASAPSPEPADARVIGVEDGIAPPRVLVVDNSDDNRVLLAHLLRAVGLPVREAVDGRAAVEAWRAWRPSFVWMDMRMPVMDGYEATRAIRAAEAEAAETGTGVPARTVIVALTASAFEHDRAAIVAAGCDAIVAKPFREDLVFQTMATHLGLRWVVEEAAPASRIFGPIALPAERLRQIPPEVRAELVRCLAEGDDLGAQSAVERVAIDDAALAESLRQLVRGFRFDELLGALERI